MLLCGHLPSSDTSRLPQDVQSTRKLSESWGANRFANITRETFTGRAHESRNPGANYTYETDHTDPLPE